MASQLPGPQASATSPAASDSAPPLVDALCATLNEQITRSLGVTLDKSVTSLAYIDHYLSLSREEQRPEILTLVATQAGAYFGEVIRTNIGAFWLGQGQDPRRLRLFLTPNWMYLAPIDIAYEAAVCESLDEQDPRHPEGDLLDVALHLQKQVPESTGIKDAAGSKSDEQWVQERLEQSPLLTAQEFHSLTGRYETMQLILELLAAKGIAQGHEPKTFTLQDYLHSLDPSDLHN